MTHLLLPWTGSEESRLTSSFSVLEQITVWAISSKASFKLSLDINLLKLLLLLDHLDPENRVMMRLISPLRTISRLVSNMGLMSG